MPPPAICMVNEGIGRPSTDPNQGHHLTSPEGRTHYDDNWAQHERAEHDVQ
jgi:hypothetical protein